MKMKSGRLAVLAVSLLAANASTASAAPATASGPAALALAHRRLSDPASVSLPIGAIAADCGFGDLSYFNQSFRRAYGETPSDVRNRARCSGSD